LNWNTIIIGAMKNAKKKNENIKRRRKIMIDHNPVEVLNNGKAKLIVEKTAIEEEINKIKNRLVDVDNAIAEYDYLIDCAKKMHMPKEPDEEVEEPIQEEELPEYEFKDSPLKQIPKRLCTTELEDLMYGKQGDAITIRTATGKHLNTSWNYLVDFYDRLPDVTRYGQITGIDKHKRLVLMSFYEAHVNFKCKIVPDSLRKSKMLIKEDVSVKTDTAPMERNIEVETV